MTTVATEFNAWWAAVGATALVGSARRALPEMPLAVPERSDASPEFELLDRLAIGAALRRAGDVPRRVADEQRPAPAEDDRLRLAPARARQLLDLLLTQPPVGARLAPTAIDVWLREATRAGVRVHHGALVRLLSFATTNRELRPAVTPVLDSRGVWLARQNADWSWASEGPAAEVVDDDEWRTQRTEQRATTLRVLRSADPAHARSLLESTWGSDGAAARAELLRALGVGLSVDDEPFLERALDDRAAGVREVAYLLLDRLPSSARAERLGRLLEPLISTTGLVRKKVHVELPADADGAAARDGLVKAARGVSRRGLWLQRLAAGAPFETWTRATGLDPKTIVTTLDDEDALRGLRAAATGRADETWCRALLERDWDSLLARCLPPEEVGALVVARLPEMKNLAELTALLRSAPGPWSAETSATVVTRLGKLERPRHQLAELVEVLAGRLHPSVAAQVQRLAAAEDGTVTPLQQLSQYLALVPTLTEAFR